MQRIGLLVEASIEPDEPVSWHPALRADHATVGETVPLCPTGEVGIPGCDRGLCGDLLPPVARGIDREVSDGTFDENDSRSRTSDFRPRSSITPMAGSVQLPWRGIEVETIAIALQFVLGRLGIPDGGGTK
jgi:hypothetical protein